MMDIVNWLVNASIGIDKLGTPKAMVMKKNGNHKLDL
jgi:hypothetical protein